VAVTNKAIVFAPDGVLVTNATGAFSSTAVGNIGTIKSLTSAAEPAGVVLSPPLADLIVAAPFHFDLVLVALPNAGTPICSGATPSCTPFAGSPLTLTESAGNTAAALSVAGTVNIGGTSEPFVGLFTANFVDEKIPNVLKTLKSSRGAVSSWSAELIATQTVGAGAAEPSTSILLLGGGLLMVAIGRARKRVVG
jgi:hypothetical protein